MQIRLSDVENRWKNLKEKISERQKKLGKLMPSVFHYVEVREQIVTWICKNEKKFNELISEMSVVSDITVMAEKQEQLISTGFEDGSSTVKTQARHIAVD